MANHLVDGFDICDPVTHCPTVYEFHRCLWHPCPSCFTIHRDRFPICHKDRTLQEVYESTLKKHDLLRQRGYDLEAQWECDWDLEVKTNQDLAPFLQTLEMVDPLDLRDAFFGGRTNAVKLHHVTDVSQGEKIKYVNMTSLYPWVNKKYEYPVGHPEVLISPEDQDIHHYFGMAKVDLLPPFGLYCPVLPHRHRENLPFPYAEAVFKKKCPNLY